MNQPNKKVSVIIVSYNVAHFIAACLDSVKKALRNIEAEIFIVDNNSSDDSCQLIKEYYPEVILIENKENLGFAKANNQAVHISNGELIHFLNPDTVIPEDFYEKSIDFLERHPNAASVGPRIIDGLGHYAIDSKKSFPTIKSSVFKILGLSKVFPKSPYWNAYYAADIDEFETAKVDILSGCCLLIKKEMMMSAGGSFDESYFMYCEDFDLCQRVNLKGFDNYYFPEVTMIHYKGESTKKLTYQYLDTFYKAMTIFVKKYYSPFWGRLYLLSIRSVLGFRSIFFIFRFLFSKLKLFILDVILLFVLSNMIKNFWFEKIAMLNEYSQAFTQTIPIFIAIWSFSLFLNGAYDKPISLFKAGRGMIIGTIIVLAWYSLFPLEYRYSRGVVLFSGMTGAIVLILARILLSFFHLITLVPRGQKKYKSAIVSNKDDYQEFLDSSPTHSFIETNIGRITTEKDLQEEEVIGSLENIQEVQQLFEINEIVFMSQSLSYQDIIHHMEFCKDKVFFNIKAPYVSEFVGDHYGKNKQENQYIYQHFQIATAEGKRNKRIFDVIMSVFLFFSFPFTLWIQKEPKKYWKSIIDVLNGQKTWIGYENEVKGLPPIKKAILPPFKIQSTFQPSVWQQAKIAQEYAKYYSVWDDLKYLILNFSYLSKKS